MGFHSAPSQSLVLRSRERFFFISCTVVTCHFWQHGSSWKETYKGKQRKQTKTRVSGGSTATTGSSLWVQLWLTNPAQLRQRKVRLWVALHLPLHGEHLKTKASKHTGFQTLFHRTLENPRELCGGTSGSPWGKGQAPGLHTCSPQHLSILYIWLSCKSPVNEKHPTA